MNETERDLRELLESKAREAGAASPAPREVVRRGRRRQAGTVAVAGITTLAVAIAAVSGLRALDRADTDVVPGEPRGNPAFTATIQNFTLTVPQGWTLIDQVPLGMSMGAISSSTSFNCTGQAIEVGGGQRSVTATTESGCTSAEVQASEPPAIPLGGWPMLTLSNEDPGLDGVACDPGGSASPTSATLYIGLDFGVAGVAGWESDYPADRGPLTDVVEGDLPVDRMPCGPGSYARFQAGGQPFIVWAGFGSEVTDADRQTIVDTYAGMQVSDAELSGPADETPGYVLAGGIRDAGPDWILEAHPTEVNVDLGYREPGGRASGVADFGVPDVPIELGGANGVVFGAVTSDAERVELRPADGSEPVIGSILELPPSLQAPFDAFVMEIDASGEVVAVGSNGDLGSVPVGGGGPGPPGPGPTIEDRRVQSDLRNAYVAAKTHYTDENTYEGFTPDVAASFEPSITYNTASTAVAGEVSIRDAGADRIVLAELSGSGTVLCIAEQPDGSTTYGAVDAQTAAECVGGEAAWGQDAVPTASPAFPPTSVPANSVAVGQSAGVSWSLGVDGDRIVLTDADGAELAQATTRPDGAASMSAHVFGVGSEAWTLVFGVATDPDAIYGVTYGQNGLRVGGPSDSTFADHVQGDFDPTTTGPIRGVAIFSSLVPGDGEGTVTLVDGSPGCRVLARFLFNGSGATPAPSAPEDGRCPSFSIPPP